MRAFGLLTVVALASCIDSKSLQCGDLTCPENYVCTSALLCFSGPQVAACDSLAEDDPCSLATGSKGVCRGGGCYIGVCGNGQVEPGEVCDDGNNISDDGCSATCASDESCGNGLVELFEECDCGDATHPGPARCNGTVNGAAICDTSCRLRRCGDGVLDPDEVCDDGNNVPGDGCSFDCASTETCGNGIVDYFAGEQCDDGALRGLDGCSAQCRGESLAWTALTPAVPPLTSHCGMVYDSGRQRFVALAGAGCEQTWELTGTTWFQRTPVTSPPTRGWSALAYDPRRGRVVMFGGDSGTAWLSDTWEYDGTTWTDRTPPLSPPQRARAAMTYDSSRKVMVMFGGLGNLHDTWEYDGTTWTERLPATFPSGRNGAALAYDPERGRSVLFGGFGNGVVNGETWEYDGTTWSQRAVAGPSAREGSAMVWDPTRHGMVLFGGSDGSQLNETWMYTGAWTKLSTTGAPSGRREPAMAMATGANPRVVMFGGAPDVFSSLNDLWQLVGTTWTSLAASTSAPTARSFASAAYDASRGVFVMFGGSSNGAETWELDRQGVWTRRSLATSPSARTGAAMTYDARRQRIVLFGGEVGTSQLDDTWEYDGTNWIQAMPATRAPARTNAAITYDATSGHVVMFGGRMNPPNGAAIYLADTWEYDGATWQQRSLVTSPSPRDTPTMAYDLRGGHAVLFGGYNNARLLDTWQLDANTWTKLALSVTPPLRTAYRLVYNSDRDRLWLFAESSRNIDLVETWQLDGTSWTKLAPSGGPVAHTFSAVEYDEILHRTVLFGGGNDQAGSEAYADTFTLGFTALTGGEVCEAARDVDGDGASGCTDDECWPYCSPSCGPTAPAATCVAFGCGDGVCSALENCRLCPDDCALGGPACPAQCGDGYCDATESAATCPGDCI